MCYILICIAFKCILLFLSACAKAKADIVFLVDESSSIGANNFIKIKDFIFRAVTYFPIIGPSATQVSLPVKLHWVINITNALSQYL